jgi:hypothetical protein
VFYCIRYQEKILIYCIGCVRNQSWFTAYDVSGINRDLLHKMCKKSIVVYWIVSVRNQSWSVGHNVSGKVHGFR